MIDTRTLNHTSNTASFEFYTDQQLKIKTITLESITFYNSWWTGDFLPAGIFPFVFFSYETIEREEISQDKVDKCLNDTLKLINSMGYYRKRLIEFCKQ